MACDSSVYGLLRMSADTHLNKHQWPRMSIDKIKGLPSVDQAAEGHLGGRVSDILPQKRQEIAEDWPEYVHMSRSMAHDGQTYPVHIGPAHQVLSDYGLSRLRHHYAADQLMLGSGHHRVAVAEELGWSHLHYSPDMHETGDEWEADALDNAVDSYQRKRG